MSYSVCGGRIEETDAYLEYIESEKIQQLINKIYTNDHKNTTQTVTKEKPVQSTHSYNDMIKKIDSLV